VSPNSKLVFVTGTSHGQLTEPIGADWATIAYNAATGAEVWVRRWDSGDADAALHVRVRPDGKTVYVSGWSHLPRADSELMIAYRASDGGDLWQKRNAIGDAFAISPGGGRIVLTGALARTTDEGHDMATRAYAAK
jgi:hypothetical protein